MRKGEESRIIVAFWPETLEGPAKAGVGEENQEFGFRHSEFVLEIRYLLVDVE